MRDRVLEALFCVAWFGFMGACVVIPQQVTRFYRWFYTRAGIDKRRLEALSPRKVRLAGALMLALILVIGLWSRIHGHRALLP